MELFAAGELVQEDLIPLCQELSNFHQQLNQAQAQLQQLQGLSPQSGGTAMAYPGQLPVNPYPLNGEYQATTYAAPPSYQPPYQTYPNATMAAPAPLPDQPYPNATVAASAPILPEYQPYANMTPAQYPPYPTAPASVPPPPPLSVSELEAAEMNASAPPPPAHAKRKRHCMHCKAEIVDHHTYCYNCGQPTRRTTPHKDDSPPAESNDEAKSSGKAHKAHAKPES